MEIKKIKISGFKSISHVEFSDISSYSVFAGSNGSGKSNFFDSLGFVSEVLNSGAINAIKRYNGYGHLHCYKKRKDSARTFDFLIEVSIDGIDYSYHMKVHDMDSEPKLFEQLKIDGENLLSRKKGESPTLYMKDSDKAMELPEFPHYISGLMFVPNSKVYGLLTNTKVYRFDPLGAKEPDGANSDSSELDSYGRNVATMLAVLEKDDDIREQIIDWMELIVPGLEKVSTEQQRLDARTVIKFKEKGTRSHFPAHLISDGTIYVLCIMTAVLSRESELGLTLIEEPERGIHPKALSELTNLMRESATGKHSIFVTTHSESIVRESKPKELWIVDKVGGVTQFRNASKISANLGDLNLDKAWLMNVFGGGLPW